MVPYNLDAIPEWVLFLGLLFIFSGSVWLGFRFGQRRRQHADELAEKEAQLSGAALTVMLTLIGFLLGFTFSMAGSNYDRRRQLVIDDANSISTTFNSTEFLQEPYRLNLQDLLIEYVDFRITINNYERTPTDFSEFINHSERLQEQMLVEGMAAANLNQTPVVAIFVNSLNNMIDNHEIRTNLRWARVPPMIFLALAFMSALAMILLGYQRGLIDRVSLLSIVLLVVIYVTVFIIIIDLDRHTDGIFSVSQQPMIELRDNLLK